MKEENFFRLSKIPANSIEMQWNQVCVDIVHKERHLHRRRKRLRNPNQEYCLLCPELRGCNRMECTFGFDFSLHCFFVTRDDTNLFRL